MSGGDDRMKAEANAALNVQEDLDCPGFESSRVFALSAQLLRNPPSGFPSRKRLTRTLGSIYLFVIQPQAAIDPSNPRTKPKEGKPETSGGALRPALWYADMKTRGVIGRGHPPKTVLGRKRKPDVVIECRDRDFVDMATGKTHPQHLYNLGRIKIRGDLDRALKISTLISHERSKIYGTQTPSISSRSADDKIAAREHEREANDQKDHDYGLGSPAPVPDRARL
ncbi:hypothetical protein BCV70DRAFT_155963 [Testicularia cyperi]|uniref:SCP2 domain-containing protein n=1 Tax=Testicularia cyperi TaxID=1882483 RepID=A0A317XY68_9BASI|nr:hypothetical protein BCV70DRAFT_155963 [Testicularia cyperi]